MERAAVFTTNKELAQPPWHALPDIDIRRVPALLTIRLPREQEEEISSP